MKQTQTNSRKTKKGNTPKKSRTPLWLAIGGVALIVFAAIYLWNAGRQTDPPVSVEVSSGPSLKVDKEKIDFGDVKVGQVVQASFLLSNVGDEPLRFTEQPYVELVEGC